MDGVYIRTDCKQILGTNRWSAVAYRRANSVGTIDDEGKNHTIVLTYAMPQLLNLAYGYFLLDTSDTNYPMYEIFKDAEQVARENRKGYWGLTSP